MRGPASPFPRADVELFGWRMVQVDGKNEFRVETKTLALKTDDGPASGRDRSGRTSRSGLLPMAHHREDAAGPIRPPGLHEHLGDSATRLRLRPGQGLHDHRPAGLSSGRAGAVQVLGRAGALRSAAETSEFAGKTFTVEIRNPKDDKVFTKEFTADAFGGFDGSFELPSDAMLGRLSGLHSQAWRRLVPGRGVQEARVRGESRCAGDAGDAR